MSYSEKLSGLRLKRCYDLAPLRIQQYLRTEIEYVVSRVEQNEKVLELGCGYGRLIPEFVRAGSYIVGIDYEKTGDGAIVCKDGFHATTFSMEQFQQLGKQLNVNTTVIEIDDSCVICEMIRSR